jgi:hypothetical protein
MQAIGFSADTKGDLKDAPARGDSSPEKNALIRDTSICMGEDDKPMNSDSNVVELEVPIKVKETKFFIGGVPPNMPRNALQGLWESGVRKFELPMCQIVDVTCHEGFGFVTVNGLSESEVQHYLSALKLAHKSRSLDVKLAVDRRIAKEIMEKNKDKKLLVCNLSKKIDNNELYRYFSQFGKLDRAYVAYDPKTRIHKHFGFVMFEDIEVAQKVLKMKIHFILGAKTNVTTNLLKNEYKDKKNMENSTKFPVQAKSLSQLPVSEPTIDRSRVSPQRQQFQLD